LTTRVRIRRDAAAPERSISITDVSVGGDYFSVLGIRLVSGRAVADADRTSSGDAVVPVVISENLAVELYDSAEAAVGRSFEFDRSGGSWRNAVVVGVAADVRSGGGRAQVHPAIYHRLPPALAFTEVLVRFSGNRAAAAANIEEAIRRSDPVAPLLRVEFLADEVRRRTSSERLLSGVTLLGGISAILLSISGVIAVATQLILDRQREFGIRAALGAAPSALTWLVLASVTTPILGGVLGGLAVYAWLGQWLRNYVFGLGTLDAVVLITVCVTVTFTGVMAALFPARRAGRISPMTALRSE